MARDFADKSAARQWVWDRLSVEGVARFPFPPHGRILAMAGWPARAGKPGGGRSAPPRGAPDRTARIVGGECVALCAAQAAAAAELRGAGLPSRGFGLLSRLCP